jgi:putative transposase
MPQSFSKVAIQIVFSTKNRENFIDETIENELFAYLGGMCKVFECVPITVGGYQNHVHILCYISRKIAIMKLDEEVKRSSSKWMKEKGEQYKNFYWQLGYGAFSVDASNMEKVIEYIKNQKEHHSKKDFKTEYLQLLKKYNIEYDEKYIWE